MPDNEEPLEEGPMRSILAVRHLRTLGVAIVVQCAVDTGKLTLVLVGTCHVAELTQPCHVRFGGVIFHSPVSQTFFQRRVANFCRPERLEVYGYGRSYEEGEVERASGQRTIQQNAVATRRVTCHTTCTVTNSHMSQHGR